MDTHPPHGPLILKKCRVSINGLLAHNGHTHTPFDYVANGTRVVCNPRGYVDRRRYRLENPLFAWDKTVDL